MCTYYNRKFLIFSLIGWGLWTLSVIGLSKNLTFFKANICSKNSSFFKAIFDNLRIHALANLPKIAKIWPFWRQILAGKNWSFFKAIFDDCPYNFPQLSSKYWVTIKMYSVLWRNFFNIFKTNLFFPDIFKVGHQHW